MSQVDPWPMPVRFRPQYGPPFPVEVLPDWVCIYVCQVAQALEVPVDLVAIPALAVVAASLAKKAEVQVNAKWREPLNIYCAGVSPPSSGKSPVFKKLTQPLVEHERSERSRLRVEVTAANARHRALKRQLDETTDEGEAQKLSEQLLGLPARALPALILDDVTAEKIAVALSENGERMAVLSSEGGGVFDGLNRYQSTPNLNIFLQGYSGDTCRVDRMGRESISLDAPALTIGLMLQPQALRALLENEPARDRGLPARFFFASPEPMVGFRRKNTSPETDEAEAAYRGGVRRLLGLPLGAVPVAVRLSPAAREVLRTFEKELEPRLRPDEGDLGHGLILDWAGKLVGGLVRVAGLFHVAEHGLKGDVDEETIQRALSLSDYLIRHAQCAFGSVGLTPVERLARSALSVIQRKGWGTCTRALVHQALGGEACRAAELQRALDMLCEWGYLRSTPLHPKQTGRPPSAVYAVNPAAHGSENSRNSRKSERGAA